MTYPKWCPLCSHPNSPDARRCVMCTAEFPVPRPCSDETAEKRRREMYGHQPADVDGTGGCDE